MTMHDQRGSGASRRDFLKTSTAAVVGGALASNLQAPGVFAQGSDEIRVGVIGCGGRGTGAIDNVLNAAPGVRLVAVGDLFKDRLEASMKNLAKHGEKAAVPADRQFVGWDAYEKVVASDVNYIILATPPAFRPMHLKANGVKRTDGDFALAWTSTYGKGRVFYTALGHRAELWRSPEYQQHLAGGIRWILGLE